MLSTAATWLSRYYARRIAPGQLDDLVQETLLAVHQKLGTYEPSRPFLPWLAAIARYRWIDALRQAYRNKERWKKIMRRGMNCDFSWKQSAAKYEGLYSRALAKKGVETWMRKKTNSTN